MHGGATVQRARATRPDETQLDLIKTIGEAHSMAQQVRKGED
jgi:hypothetical protein